MAVTQAPRVSQRGRDAPPSPVRKLMPLAAAAKARGTTVYHINIGQPDLATPEPILASIRSYSESVLPYAPSRGMPETLSAWSSYYAAVGYDIPTDELIVTTGGSEALAFAFMAVADPGDEILLFEPTYANYFGFAVGSAIETVAITLDPEDGFHLPASARIQDAITARTRAICISNPNNPTGTVYDRQELEELLEVAVRNDLFVISDETYRELVFDGLEHTSMLEFDSSEARDRVIIVDSVSKRFSATGARVGCLVSRNPAIMDAVGRFAQARLSAPTVEQLAVVPMLKDPLPYTSWLRSEYEGRRNAVYEHLLHADLACRKPSGAFYIMVTLPVEDCDDFAMWLLTDFDSNGETVMVAPGAGFYLTRSMGRQQARLAYVLNKQDLARAVDILGEALRQYPGGRA